MRPATVFGVLLVVVFLTVSCSGTLTPDAEGTSAAGTAAASAAVTPTPTPTNTPMPTDTAVPTPTRSPTGTPVPTPTPELTEEPPAPPPSDTPVPTDTPVPEMLPAPELLAPQDNDTFAGIATDVTFSWSPAPRELAEDEYYVLIITHDKGNDYTWTKGTSFSISENKSWMGELGPAYMWQVVVAWRSPGQTDDNPAGRETSAYSPSRVCYWNF